MAIRTRRGNLIAHIERGPSGFLRVRLVGSAHPFLLHATDVRADGGIPEIQAALDHAQAPRQRHAGRLTLGGTDDH